MRLRNTTRCAVVPARSPRSSVARCSGVSGKAGARFMPSTVPKPGRKYKAIGDHCTRSDVPLLRVGGGGRPEGVVGLDREVAAADAGRGDYAGATRLRAISRGDDERGACHRRHGRALVLGGASGIETAMRADLARLDRKRPKKGRSTEWRHPNDPDARISTKRWHDGRIHLAHKAEHANDPEDRLDRGCHGAGCRPGRHLAHLDAVRSSTRCDQRQGVAGASESSSSLERRGNHSVRRRRRRRGCVGCTRARRARDGE